MSELGTLARTAGADVVGTIIQRLRHPDVATYTGKGRAQELSDLEKQLGFELVICDDELSPSQQRNLEKFLEVRVIDRTALILDIFAQHARTREGRLQVELAQLEYRLPRLAGRGVTLSRQAGGSRSAGDGGAGAGGAIGVRGPGETKLEIDRRLIRSRISDLRESIEQVREQRTLHRRQRASQAIPVIAIVGYTNAGKSTLFNALTEADVVAENKLFATLDPITRHVVLPGKSGGVVHRYSRFHPEIANPRGDRRIAVTQQRDEGQPPRRAEERGHGDQPVQPPEWRQMLTNSGIEERRGRQPRLRSGSRSPANRAPRDDQPRPPSPACRRSGTSTTPAQATPAQSVRGHDASAQGPAPARPPARRPAPAGTATTARAPPARGRSGTGPAPAQHQHPGARGRPSPSG